MISYELKRSKRKTVSIHITPDARIEVRAPMQYPKSAIDKLVAEKESWILSHQEVRQSRLDDKQRFSLNYGDTVTLCGKPCPLRAKEGNVAGYDDDGFYLPPRLDEANMKRCVVLIYKLAAKNINSSMVADCSGLMGLVPTSVKISSAKTRWGSCSSRGSLNFSWRLIMADEQVICYVVVHELAHLREQNHSSEFWALVERYEPDYRSLRAELKSLQDKLSREDWD